MVLHLVEVNPVALVFHIMAMDNARWRAKSADP